jgi:CCR4-NOT transcriptional regulation complex NOT5 subunit
MIEQLSAEDHALLVEIMRKRRANVEAEIDRLQRERDDLDAWLAEHDPVGLRALSQP